MKKFMIQHFLFPVSWLSPIFESFAWTGRITEPVKPVLCNTNTPVFTVIGEKV